jgi:hypothetical protein
MTVDNQYDEYDEYRAFLDRIPQIRLMVLEILLNPLPMSEQPDILKKLNKQFRGLWRLVMKMKVLFLFSLYFTYFKRIYYFP